MKNIILLIFLLIIVNSAKTQSVNISIFNGFTSLSSNFSGRYSPSYSFGMSLGYVKIKENIGFNANLGLFSNVARINEIDRKLTINTIRLMAGPSLKLKKDFLLSIDLSAGKMIQKSIRISRPKYNYDFDPIEISVYLEISKLVYKSKKKEVSIGIALFRNIDGIIDNNFWQKDVLKITNIFISAKYIFK